MRLSVWMWRRTETIKQGGEVIGNRTRVKVVKNNKWRPHLKRQNLIFRKVNFQRKRYSGSGCEINGNIQKSGAWFAYNDGKIGQGRENAKIFLRGASGDCGRNRTSGKSPLRDLDKLFHWDAEKDVDKAKDVLTDASDDEV